MIKFNISQITNNKPVHVKGDFQVNVVDVYWMFSTPHDGVYVNYPILIPYLLVGIFTIDIYL